MTAALTFVQSFADGHETLGVVVLIVALGAWLLVGRGRSV